MKVKPRGNRVLLELDNTPHTFAEGRLVIARVPDREGDYKFFPQRGTVVEIGPNTKDVEIGDHVVCTKHHGVHLPRGLHSGADSIQGRAFGELILVKEDFILFRIMGGPEIGYGVSHVEGPGPLKGRR